MQFFILFRTEKSVKKRLETTKASNISAPFIQMTDKQRLFLANKLSELPVMGGYSEGTESYSQFAARIGKMLKAPQNLKS